MRQRTLADGTVVSALSLGAMFFGTRVDEETSFAILDRFVDAGGTVIDTSDNYAYWIGGTGHDSEPVVGRWLASRGARDRVVLSTKVGAMPTAPGTQWWETGEGLSAGAIRSAIEGSLQRLGTDHVDVYWSHVEDRSVPLEETLGTFAELIAEGKVRTIGESNHAGWRIERARAVSRANGWPRYTSLQHRYTYFQPRPEDQEPAQNTNGNPHLRAYGSVGQELLDYVRNEDDLTLWVYTALLSGAYSRPDKPIPEAYEHPGTDERRKVLSEVAAEIGATQNQVVLAWLMGGDPPLLPIVGASSVSQLDEILAATDIDLDESQRTRLNAAG
jgi:aryl-alcohol dehydrogenase-like predicted oxidoreductase